MFSQDNNYKSSEDERLVESSQNHKDYQEVKIPIEDYYHNPGGTKSYLCNTKQDFLRGKNLYGEQLPLEIAFMVLESLLAPYQKSYIYDNSSDMVKNLYYDKTMQDFVTNINNLIMTCSDYKSLIEEFLKPYRITINFNNDTNKQMRLETDSSIIVSYVNKNRQLIKDTSEQNELINKFKNKKQNSKLFGILFCACVFLIEMLILVPAQKDSNSPLNLNKNHNDFLITLITIGVAIAVFPVGVGVKYLIDRKERNSLNERITLFTSRVNKEQKEVEEINDTVHKNLRTIAPNPNSG